MIFSIIPAGIGYGIEECIMSSPSILHVRTMLSKRTFSREKFEIDEIARQVGTDQPCKTAPCMIDIPATIRREALVAGGILGKFGELEDSQDTAPRVAAVPFVRLVQPYLCTYMYPLTLCTAAALPMMSYEVEVPPVVHGTWNTMCDDRDMCQEEGEKDRLAPRSDVPA